MMVHYYTCPECGFEWEQGEDEQLENGLSSCLECGCDPVYPAESYEDEE